MLTRIAKCLTQCNAVIMNAGCRAFQSQEFRQMLSRCRTQRDRTLLVLGVRSGFRVSELLALDIKDVWNRKVLHNVCVARRHMKGKKQGRSIPLHEEARREIAKLVDEIFEAHGKRVDLPLFMSTQGPLGSRLSRYQAWRMVKGLAERLDLEGKIATHSWRKTFAKRVHHALGEDLLKTRVALGHKSLDSTARYLNVDEKEISRAILGGT